MVARMGRVRASEVTRERRARVTFRPTIKANVTPELRDLVHQTADAMDISVADLLERALLFYLEALHRDLTRTQEADQERLAKIRGGGL